MKKLLLMLPLLCGCAHQYIEAAQWYSASPDLAQGGPITFEVGTENEDGTLFCAVSHLSTIYKGWPFNSEVETTYSAVGCGARYYFR